MRIINRRPNKGAAYVAAAIPFVLAMLLYWVFSDLRLQENPDDKLLPSATTLIASIDRMAFQESKRTGEILLWQDTGASLERLAVGVAMSALAGLCFGILNGIVPWFSALWSPFVRVLSMIPPMAVLPILFIVFGLGELSKYVLIFVGTAPFIIRDLEQRVRELPYEQIIKAQTLSATSWQVIIRVGLSLVPAMRAML